MQTEAAADSPAATAEAPERGFRSLARNSAVAALAVVGNGALSAAILALCSSLGQTDEIAAYAVVTAAMAFVAIFLAGGSPLLYLNGTDEQRALVRSQWAFVVLPGLLIGSIAVAAFYAWRGYDVAALAAACVVVLGNGLAQLQTADFSRRMRFLSSALLLCGSKAASLLMVLAGAPLTVALGVMGLVQIVVGEAILGRLGRFRRAIVGRPSVSGAVTAYRSSWHLFGYAVGDLYVIRAPTVVLSILATPAVMGSFGAVVTAYQAIGGVVQSALQVPMAARARDRLGIERSKHPAGFSIAVGLVGAIPGAITVALLAPWLTGRLLKLPDPDAATWLTVFMIGLPFLAVTRALMFNWIGDAQYGRATRAVFVLAAVQAVTVAVGVPWLGARGAAGATAAAEVVAMLVIVAFFTRRR